jgi:small-conductance mechanosensitive channel
MDSLRSALIVVREWLDWLPNPAAAALMIALAALIALVLHLWLRRLLRRVLALRYPLVFSTLTQMRGLTQLAVLIVALAVALPVAPLDQATRYWAARLLLIAGIVLIGWAAMTALRIGGQVYLGRFRLDSADNLLARKHVTQVHVLQRAADVLVIVITLAAALMTFEPVRQYGVSLFASAGVAGLIAGLAARPVLSNLFAGVQLAMTQPIRIDDAVIVENEWGVIEEITSAYVVVRLWDLRRMIVPLTYFIEKPFQNWTRETSALIGNVLFYLDYRAPIAVMREKLKEILAASENWDGKVAALQVTDTKQSAIEVRAIMSAKNAGATFALRCEVREKMIDFLQKEHPEALPLTRQVTIVERGGADLAAAQEAVRLAPEDGDSKPPARPKSAEQR